MTIEQDLAKFFANHPIIKSPRNSSLLLLMLGILGTFSFFYTAYQFYNFLLAVFTLIAWIFERPSFNKSKEEKVAELQAKIDKLSK